MPQLNQILDALLAPKLTNSSGCMLLDTRQWNQLKRGLSFFSLVISKTLLFDHEFNTTKGKKDIFFHSNFSSNILAN